MIIAVDFDGTIVEHRYPAIGREIPFAFATLRKLMAERNQLILWTVREGALLDEAVEYCRKNGVEFYAVNSNFAEETPKENATMSCRKVRADLYIDDRNLGGLPDWGAVYEMVHNHWTYTQYLEAVQNGGVAPKPTFWQRLLGKG